MPKILLPVDPFVARIARATRDHRAVVVTAAPGAGKTTRVPPALVDDGPVLLLQPRRVAARAIARRIADECGWTVGREVGWHVRFERRFSKETQLLVATEGVLTARLQDDPLLSDFTTVVLDEFHERSIHADLGLTLVRQAALARSDLRIIVMSATLDAERVAAFLGGCPVIAVPGRMFAVETSYRPGVAIESAVSDAIGRANGGALLCFLPGAPEIRRAGEALAGVLPPGIDVCPLHGGLDALEQDRALQPADRPRVILATNIAETTLTVPDVRAVVDTGWQKVARYDAARGIDSLETERISLDAADQRSGRAGRTGPGTAIRLWDARDRLRPHREAEIARVDLASTVMDVIAWGGDPRTLAWFEAPPAESIALAMELLRALDAIDVHGRLTPTGDRLRRLPLHPRLARMVLAAHGAPSAALACAVLSERGYAPTRGEATTCDLLAAIERERALPRHIVDVANQIRRIAQDVLGAEAKPRIDEAAFRRSVLAGYPDRVGRRRAPRSERVVLTSGTGARMGRESGVFDSEFLVAVDVARAPALPAGKPVSADAADAIIRIATGIERDWIRPTSSDVEHRWDEASQSVKAVRTQSYGAIVLSETVVPADPDVAGPMVARAYLQQERSEPDLQLQSRLACAGVSADFAALVEAASHGATRLSDLDLVRYLPPDVRRAIDRDAPWELLLPSRRHAKLQYQPGGRIVAAVKLQELFGLAETPRIGKARMPVTFELLAPNGRPVQVTSDLGSFWRSGYQDVRKELRARYPRHPWPEDPWTAVPTHRPIGRRVR